CHVVCRYTCTKYTDRQGSSCYLLRRDVQVDICLEHAVHVKFYVVFTLGPSGHNMYALHHVALTGYLLTCLPMYFSSYGTVAQLQLCPSLHQGNRVRRILQKKQSALLLFPFTF